MLAEKKWHVLYTRPKWEKKVDQQLRRKKLESYCPLNKIARQWADRKKLLEVPLFTSYVFVHIDAAETLVTRQTEGVLNFVFWLGKPAVVRDEEIMAIRTFTLEYQRISVEKLAVNVSDRVRIIDGPLMLLEGHILEVKTNTVKVQLPSLGCALSAEISRGSIELVRPAKRSMTNQGSGNNEGYIKQIL